MKQITVVLVISLILGGLFLSAQEPSSPITKAALQTHLGELTKLKDQALARFNAYTGAVQECQYWLDQIEVKEKAAGKMAKQSEKSEVPFDSANPTKEKKNGD